MQNISRNTFFMENEQHLNKMVLSLMRWAYLSPPLLILGKIVGVFKEVSYTNLFFIMIVTLAFLFFLDRHYAKHSESPTEKYILLGTLELIIAAISVIPGLCLFLSYLIVPICSCLYFDKKFTRRLLILGYVVMILSLVYRGLFTWSVYMGTVTRSEWIFAYSVGMSIEYIPCAVGLYFIAQAAFETMYRVTTKNANMRATQSELIKSFVGIIEPRDVASSVHIKRVGAYTSLICKKLREYGYYANELTTDVIEYIEDAAPLYDVGKTKVAPELLAKKGKLSEEEFAKVKLHTEYGARLIDAEFGDVEDAAYVRTAREIALSHHERWDGSGYPNGLIEAGIPVGARIVAVVDALDALISPRPYKEACSLDEAFVVICEQSGAQFDPLVVKALMQLKEEIRAYNESESVAAADMSGAGI